jgi:ParB family chromosome partitioning protein
MGAKKQAFDSGKRANLYRFDPRDLVLVDDPEHPLYDERVHLPTEESLVRNIAMHGVIEPVIICKIGGDPVVVDGRQRVKAALEASDRLEAEGKERVLVPCMTRRGNAESLFGVSVSANEHRKDDSPLGRAHKMLRLLETGRSAEECSIIFGVTPQTITNWLTLVELPNAVQDAVDRGDISATAASCLSGLSHRECKLALAKLLSEAGSKKPSKRKVVQATGGNGYRFRTRKDALEAAPQKYREQIKPLLAGSPAARIVMILAELAKVEGIRTNHAYVALCAMVNSKE